MEIVKQLNLNKNPQTTQHLSLVFAKNMRLSNDGSCLQSDNGFKEAIIPKPVGGDKTDAELIAETLISNVIGEVKSSIEGEIVGFICCPQEIVILSYEKDNNISHIYRAIEYSDREGLLLVEISTAWTYSYGKIKGTYTYNINGELIVAIAESEANKEVPLKSINLNKSSYEDSENFYYTAPHVPIGNLQQIGYTKGVIPQGTYFFFIRYKLNSEQYSNWFPIGKPCMAIKSEDKVFINNKPDANNASKTSVSYTVNNTNKDCDKTFVFRFTSFGDTKYIKSFQLGYILQHDGDIIGRKNYEYDINTTNIIFKSSSENEDIDNFVKNTFCLYDVKNVTSFENRLYVSNYKETDYNIDLQTYADYIDVSCLKSPVLSLSESSTIPITKRVATFYIGRCNVINIPSITTAQIINEKKFTVVFNPGITKISVSDIPDLKEHLLLLAKEAGLQPKDRSLTAYTTDRDVREIGLLDKLSITIYSNENTIDFITDNGQRLPTYYGGPETGHTIIGRFLYDSKHYNNNKLCFVITKLNDAGSGITQSTEDIDKTSDVFYTDDEIRTLSPFSVYSFYVHYVRPDGTYTNGLKLKYKENKGFTRYTNNNGETYFKTGNCLDIQNSTTVLNKLDVMFSNIVFPEGYIGAFFSYELPEGTSYCCYHIEKTNKTYAISGSNNLFYAPDVLFGNKSYYGDKIIDANTGEESDITNITIVPSNSYNESNNDKNTINQHGGVYITSSLVYNDNHLYITVKEDKNLYQQKEKQLISLGYIASTSEYSTSENISNLPSFVNKTCYFFYYTYKILADEDKIYTYQNDSSADLDNYNNAISARYAVTKTVPIITTINTKAISVKREPEYKYVFKENNHKIYKVLNPINYDDTFELKSMFVNNYIKLYTNYDRHIKYNNVTTNIVRRSNVIGDENLENLWLKFDSNDYKIIDTNKGKITNLIAISNNLICQTENTIFVLAKDSKLDAQEQTVDISAADIFDLTPMEVGDASYGLGGLKASFSKAYTKNIRGYTFYDSDTYNLYVLEEQKKISLLSLDITEFLKNIGVITDVRFLTEPNNNRMFISFLITIPVERYNSNNIQINRAVRNIPGSSDSVEDEVWIVANGEIIGQSLVITEGNTDAQTRKEDYYDYNDEVVIYDDTARWITLSFDLNTAKFISLHDFHIEEDVHTNYKGYFFGKGNKLYYSTEDNNIATPCDYKDLSESSEYYPVYSDKSYWNSETDKKYCCLDVFFNPYIIQNRTAITLYEHPKVLDSISYIVDRLTSYLGDDYENLAELYMENELFNDTYKYGADLVQIYTNLCDTGLLDVRIPNTQEINQFNNYKYPYYDKGIWNLNYFRNNIATEVTEEELQEYATKFNISLSKLKDCYKIIDIHGVPHYRKSDNRSLINGLYFVVRFIFNMTDNTKHVRINNVDINYKTIQ